MKRDKGKSPLFRGLMKYFPRAMRAVAGVSDKGYDKYHSWGGWVTVAEGFDRYSDAMLRHLVAEQLEETDEETGCLHAAQVAWNAMARLELKLRESEKHNETRPI